MAQLAREQHGVVSARQLKDAGIGDTATRRRVESGRLHRVHHGVYAVGYKALTFEQRCMAAVLACGDGAVVSRRSAAAVWGLLDSHEGAVHVSVPRTHGRAARKDIRLHRCPSLTKEQTTRRERIPVTTSARTLADLRKEVDAAAWRRAVRRAEVLGLRTGLVVPLAPTRSELEDRFLSLCRRHRLPRPEVNLRIGRREVDFLWRRQRLVVETDGYRFHRGAIAFEDDHARNLDLGLQGFAVLHFTWKQVTTTPDRVAALIRRELEEP